MSTQRVVERAREVLHDSRCRCGDYVLHDGYYEDRIDALDRVGLLVTDQEYKDGAG